MQDPPRNPTTYLNDEIDELNAETSEYSFDVVFIIETINECILKQLTICNGICVLQSLVQCDLFSDTMTSRDFQ